MKRRLGLASLLLPLAACAGAAEPAPKPKAAHPALWRLADSDTQIWLFGTIHLLPEGQRWRSPAFDRALAGADELVLEIANVDDLMASAQALRKLGVSSGLPPIAERVPEDKRSALRAMIAESGYPESAFDKLETWAAALPLLGVSFRRLGLDPQLGVERQIGAPFRAGGKPVVGLGRIRSASCWWRRSTTAPMPKRSSRRCSTPGRGATSRGSPAPSTTRPRCRRS
jgi:uncharacterized protein